MPIEREIEPPEPGATLYDVWNGHLNTAKFLRVDYAPGATKPTWLVRDTGKTVNSRCSTDYWCKTEIEAYRRYAKELESAIPSLLESIAASQKSLSEARQHLDTARQRIEELKHGDA